MSTNLPLPGRGQDLYSYLYQLVERLNTGFSDAEVALERATQGTGANVVNKATEERLGATYNDLKALIIKSADEVEVTLENAFTYQMKNGYVAKSEYGTYQQQVQTLINATGQAIEAVYDYAERIDQDGKNLRGYIRQGVIEIDGEPQIGIAIGKDLSSHTYGGVEYLDTDKYFAFYTANKLGFWVNGQEVAYFANNELHVNAIRIETSLTINDKWKLSNNDTLGFTLQWIG